MFMPTSTQVSSEVITGEQRQRQKRQQPFILWLSGLSGAGKTTLATAIDKALYERGYHSMLLDGDTVRHGLCADLGFSADDRLENIRRVAETARLCADAGLIVIAALISPLQQHRELARQRAAEIPFIEVFVNTPLAICEQRDPKGLYRKARRGEIPLFTGISSPYEAPLKADISIQAATQSLDRCVAQVLRYLDQNGLLSRLENLQP